MYINMWDKVSEAFKRSNKALEVARAIIRLGMHINSEGKIFCGGVRIPYTSLSKMVKSDRRTVKQTVETILQNDELKEFFMNIEPAGPLLRKISGLFGYRCLTVEPVRDQPGIIASVTFILAKRNINVVQIVAEDPHLYEQPKLYIVVSDEVSGELLDEILRQPLVRSITIS